MDSAQLRRRDVRAMLASLYRARDPDIDDDDDDDDDDNDDDELR